MPASSAGQELEVRQMLNLATKHGYACQLLAPLTKELANAIAIRMRPRVGSQVYQMISFSRISYPLAALDLMFPEEHVTEVSGAAKAWSLTSIGAMSATLDPFLNGSDYVCAGSTRAFRTKSQRVIRLVAMLLPDWEVTHYELSGGGSHTQFNGMYALMADHGGVTWPKDNNRKELAFPEAIEKELRQQVLSDLLLLHTRGEPLSPAWLRKLGKPEMALQVEAELAAPRRAKAPRRQQTSRASRVRKPMVTKQPRFTKESFEVEQILAQKKVSSKAKVLYLVRWVGYDPSWEALRISGSRGDPIDT